MLVPCCHCIWFGFGETRVCIKGCYLIYVMGTGEVASQQDVRSVADGRIVVHLSTPLFCISLYEELVSKAASVCF